MLHKWQPPKIFKEKMPGYSEVTDGAAPHLSYFIENPGITGGCGKAEAPKGNISGKLSVPAIAYSSSLAIITRAFKGDFFAGTP